MTESLEDYLEMVSFLADDGAVRITVLHPRIPINLPALKGGVSCKRCIIYEVRSVRKLFNRGVYYHFLLVLPILTALKGGVLDPTANKDAKDWLLKTLS